MQSTEPSALLETIGTLALEIARHCPDCAEKASRIAALAAEVVPAKIDRGAIQDALETELGDGDVSDLHVRTATEAVVKAAKT